MTKKEDIPDMAVVCECGAFCYRDPSKNELLTCVKCGKQYEADAMSLN